MHSQHGAPNALLLVLTLAVAHTAMASQRVARIRNRSARRAACAVRSRIVKWGRGDVVIGRVGNKLRQRMCWATRLESLTKDGDIKPFLKRYKVSPTKFQEIANKIRPLVEARNISQAMRASRGGGHVTSEIRLKIFLRFLAGAHYLNLVEIMV